MNSVLEQFLAVVDTTLRRPVIERTRPDLLPVMRPWGREWGEYARELGVPCPPALVELRDAMTELYISVQAEHGWVLLTPDDSRIERRSLGELALEFPELVERSEMMPVFGQDGDLYLLAGDGRVHAFTHDYWENDKESFASFDELLRSLTEQAQTRAAHDLEDELENIIIDVIRKAPDLPGSLSVRATDEAYVYLELEHPIIAEDGRRSLPEILKTAFCGRFPGRWDDVTTDAGAVWALVRKTLAAFKVPLPEDDSAR